MINVQKLSEFGVKFQIRLLSALQIDSSFLLNIIDILDQQDFQTQELRFVYKVIKETYLKYNKTPDIDVFKSELVKISNDKILQQLVIRTIKQMVKQYKYDNMQYIKDNALQFCRKQALERFLISIAQCSRNYNSEQIMGKLSQVIKIGGQRNIGKVYSRNFEQRYSLSIRNPISTGWDRVDDIMGGGLDKGQLGVVIAPSGGGKSWLLTALGTSALLQGKTVLHYSMQLKDISCQLRYDATITKIPYNILTSKKQDVKDILQSRNIINIDQNTQSPIGQLVLKQYPTGTASVQTLRSHFKLVQMQIGKPDLVIIDYADLLYRKYRTKVDNEYTALGNLYEQLRAMAQEYGVPIWTATQTNRGGVESQIIYSDLVADSYKKIMVADFVMSLARNKQQKESDSGKIYVVKSRVNKDGIVFDAKIDLGIGQFILMQQDKQKNNKLRPLSEQQILRDRDRLLLLYESLKQDNKKDQS